MGKATIISEAGEGLYNVEVNHDYTAADAKLLKLQAILDRIEKKLAEAEDETTIAYLNLRKATIEKEIDRLESYLDMDYRTQAWCADFTEGLTGAVGTIEPGAEIKNGINIQPGHDGNAGHDLNRDGQVTPFYTLDVADAMRNFAIMPAIQKWKPTYRYGTISNLDKDEDTCTVTLDPLASSVQSLDINVASTLNNVPIDYMTCNASAFEDGDRVIVTWVGYDVANTAKVIGFVDNPKPCGWKEPWNGPAVTSRHPWIYWYSWNEGEGEEAEFDLKNGVLTISYPDATDYIQQHQLYMIPEQPFYLNATKIKFRAESGLVYCGSYISNERTDCLYLGGWAEDGLTIVEFYLYTAFTTLQPFIGCITNTYMNQETDWILEEEVTEIYPPSWAPPLDDPEGTYPYRGYTRNIGPNIDTFFDLPEICAQCCAIAVQMATNSGLGIGYTPTGPVGGGKMSIDHIGIM